MNVDIEHLRSWIGRTETLSDVATLAPLRGLSATLDRDDAPPAAGDAIPPCWHWLYFLPMHRQSLVGEDVVSQLQEDQRAGAAVLQAHVLDVRAALQCLAGTRGGDELQLAARPHAARQRHRRQEVAALGMAVRADLRLGRDLQEVEPVPERRQGIAGLRVGIVLLVEGRGQGADREGGGEILHGLRPADPVLEFFQRHLGFPLCRA